MLSRGLLVQSGDFWFNRYFWCKAAASVTLIGSMLPWATVSIPFLGQTSLAGTDGDGILTLIVATIALLVLTVSFLGNRNLKHIALISLLCGIVITFIDLTTMATLENAFADDPDLRGLASAGIGLYMTIIGGLALAASAGFGVFMLKTAEDHASIC